MSKSGYRGIVPFVFKQVVDPGVRWAGTFDHYLISVTLEGGTDYQLPDGEIQVCSGDLLWFAPGAWQDWTTASQRGWKVFYIITDLPTPMQELLPPANLDEGIGRISLPGGLARKVESAYSVMGDWSNRRTAISERLVINQLEYMLLMIRDAFPLDIEDDRIERARSFLHRRIEQRTSLDDVARLACLSKSRLCALFNQATGVAPLQYLEGLRMDRAAQLRRLSALRIDDIAEKLCFNDRKYFDRRFKRHWLVTPYRYRRDG